MGKTPLKASSTELWEEIDTHIRGWIVDGLIERTDWDGLPLLVSPIGQVEGVYFDAEAVERVLKFFLLLKQQIGRWAGQDFRLLDWQVRYIIAPVFGLKRADGLRLIRTIWVEIPRKNGKSTLWSGLSLYMLMADREAAAQVFAAAGDRKQATIVFGASREMAAGSPSIVKALGKKGIQRYLLEHPRTHSTFRALSSEGARQHGLNVHFASIDEVHVHKTPDLIDALETGTGAREQPLVAFITTADDGDETSIYAIKHEYIEGLASGTVVDATQYAVVFGVDNTVEDFDAFSEETLRKANPGAGITVLMDYLTAKAEEARQSPAQLNRYLRLHLNIRTKQTTRFITLDDWDRTASMADASKWASKVVYGGLDLSTTTDLTSCVLVLPDDGYDVWPMFWIPEERAELFERKYQIPFSRWRRAGFIRYTEGSIIDYEQVREDIAAEVKMLGCQVAGIGYDPWNAPETVIQMTKAGFVMVSVAQSYANLSAPAKEVERLVLGSSAEHPLLRHGGHPVLRWNVDCVEVRQDANGNIRPVKPQRQVSSKRIDGFVALDMAIGQAMLDVEESSNAQDWLNSVIKTCPSCGHMNSHLVTACVKCRTPISAAG